MKKIFGITCHQMTQPLRLTVDYLASDSNNTIVIHVDKKMDIEEFRELESENVHLLASRVNVSWGGVSQIYATNLILSYCLLFKFDYFFLISGDDLPCKKNDQLNYFIESIAMANLIHFQDERNSFVNPLDRVKYKYPSFFFSKNKGFLNKLNRKLYNCFKFLFINEKINHPGFSDISFYKGTNWFSLNYNSVKKIMGFISQNPWYTEAFEYSLCGDEVYYHTIIKHIKIKDLYKNGNAMNDALRYIDWKTGPDYPKVLDLNDLPKIVNSSCLFARKFDKNVSEDFLSKLLDC